MAEKTHQEVIFWEIMETYKKQYYNLTTEQEFLHNASKKLRDEITEAWRQSTETADVLPSLDSLHSGVYRANMLKFVEERIEAGVYPERISEIVNSAKKIGREIVALQHTSVYALDTKERLSVGYYRHYVDTNHVNLDVLYPGLCTHCKTRERNCIYMYLCEVNDTQCTMCDCSKKDPVHSWCSSCLFDYFDEMIKGDSQLYSFDKVSCFVRCPVCTGNVCQFSYAMFVSGRPVSEPPQINMSNFLLEFKDKMEEISEGINELRTSKEDIRPEKKKPVKKKKKIECRLCPGAKGHYITTCPKAKELREREMREMQLKESRGKTTHRHVIERGDSSFGPIDL
jgi:hypothetical protein